MKRYLTKPINGVDGVQKIEQLIELDTRKTQYLEHPEGVWELFTENIEIKYRSSLRSLLNIMVHVANNQSIPGKYFKDITPRTETVKEYEFKQGDLRVYAIKIPGGKLILLCGFKNRQSKDISKFRSLKKIFLNNS